MVAQELSTPCAYVPRTDTFRPFVYGLVDPLEPKHVRYVGMAMKATRPYEHAKNARDEKKHSHLFHWIRLLRSEGREPSVLVLEELVRDASRSFVGDIERMYISSLRSIGHRLTNVSAGGWGGDGGPEVNARISAALKGRPLLDATKKKISETLTGRKLSAEHRAAQSGWHHSDASRAQMSATRKGRSYVSTWVRSEEYRAKQRESSAKRGYKHTAETKEHIRQSKLGWKGPVGNVHPPETRVKMSESRAAYWANRRALLAAMTPEQLEEERRAKKQRLLERRNKKRGVS